MRRIPRASRAKRLEQHRGSGTTADVEYATRKEPLAVLKSHVNYVVPDSQWERVAAYALDVHPAVHSFAKNSGLGFSEGFGRASMGRCGQPRWALRAVVLPVAS